MKSNSKNILMEMLDKQEQFSYTELLSLLNKDDFDSKHFALTCLHTLEKPEDITIIINHLVDNDTKIRELSSYRVADFVLENNSLISFLDELPDIIIRTANDMNSQVCRNILNLLYLSSKKDLFITKFLAEIQACIEDTRVIKYRTHKADKRMFNLYWNLYALENILTEDFKYFKKLSEILSITSKYKDYTIRERSALLTKKLNSFGFNVESLLEHFNTDDNFYIKMVFADKTEKNPTKVV